MNLHNGMNIIDSRDVITRLDELRDERNDLAQAVEDAKETLNDAKDPTSAIALDEEELQALQYTLDNAMSELDGWDENNAEELKALEALDEEGRDATSEWKYGEQLIRDSHFQRFAQEFAAEVGIMPDSDLRWPFTCIDWEKAAEELQQDYTSVNFDNVVYWVRSS